MNENAQHDHISKEQYSSFLKEVRVSVVPTDYSKEFLQVAAHKEFEDLSIVAHLMAPQEDGSIKPVLVTANGLDVMGIDQEQFMKDAIAASEQNFPGKTTPLPSFLFRDDIPGDSDLAQILIASTQDMTNGAAVMLYPDFMDRVAQELGGNLYILPSSRHEVLLLKENSFLPLDELKEIVHQVNRTEVDIQDRLSDNVYHYDAAERKLEIGEHYQERKAHEKEAKHSLLGELKASKGIGKQAIGKSAHKKEEPGL